MIRLNQEDGSVFCTREKKAFHVSPRGLAHWWERIEMMLGSRWRRYDGASVCRRGGRTRRARVCRRGGRVESWEAAGAAYLPVAAAVSADELREALAHLLGARLARAVVNRLAIWDG